MLGVGGTGVDAKIITKRRECIGDGIGSIISSFARRNKVALKGEP